MKTSDTRPFTLRRFAPSLARWTMGTVATGLALCSFGVTERTAFAGGVNDVAPSLPNVLLLIDTSGSMELMPSCYPSSVGTTCLNVPEDDTGVAMIPGSTATVTYNKWASAIQVIAGTFKHYSIVDESRKSRTSSGALTDFVNEFGLYNNAGSLVYPYDADETLDHYRVMSNSCAIGPGISKSWTWTPPASLSPGVFYSLTAGFDDSAASVFRARHWTSGAFADDGVCTVAGVLADLDGTGIVDVYSSQARFGLMTFDPQTDGHTGRESAPPANAVTGIEGLWSYFPGWYTGGLNTGTPTYGWPNGCVVDTSNVSSHIFENGARNPSAPPWEGPLVPFSPDDNSINLANTNKAIKLAMLAERPFGGTPIAAMLTDAEYYYWNDPNGLNGDPTKDCRGDFIILITDGVPNQDLRPYCETGPTPQTSALNGVTCGAATVPSPSGGATAAPGCCPYMRPQDIAYNLAHPTNPSVNHPVQTFVIGFSVSDDTGAPLCGDVTLTLSSGATQTFTVPWSGPASTKPAPINCNTISSTDPRSACCTLEQIAINGTTGTTPQTALFANDASGLRTAVSSAMSAAIHSTATSRTTPVYAQSTSNQNTTLNVQDQYTSNFIPNPVSGWQGVLQREQITCSTNLALPYTPLPGDNFAADLADPAQRATRNYITYRTGVTVGPYAGNDGISIRPNISVPTDGVMANVGPSTGQNVSVGTAVVNTSSPTTGPGIGLDDLGLTPASAGCKGPSGTALAVADCATMQVNYAAAQPQPVTGYVDRSATPLADIYHANPVTVSPPLAGLRDSTYTTWAQSAAIANRPPFLLVATNDGILHAFSTQYNGTYTSANPFEYFSFIPPAVLPLLPSAYGGVHQLLLDSSPVVKDVAFGGSGGTVPWGRSLSDAQSGLVTWKTVALGGLTGSGGYYALDVTDPTHPQMLWQLTTVGNVLAQYPLFGGTPAQPEIGTVTVTQGSTLVETPVAFLPGGSGSGNSGNSAACKRWSAGGAIASDPNFQPRTNIPCWVGPGLSFTVVRLYDGVILRSFRNQWNAPTGSQTHPGEGLFSATGYLATTVPSLVLGVSNAPAQIDSPISGTVAIYPNVTGAVTSRAYVGDQDGTLWKLDVSSTNPTNWTFTLFHDAYSVGSGDSALNVQTTVGATTTPAGQPVDGAPLLTTDQFGNTVVLYATGDQANFVTYNINHVYSITDSTIGAAAGTTSGASVNWGLRFNDGTAPTGPLTLFGGALYMSTFTPNSTLNVQNCLTGYALLWGLDYILNDGSAAKVPMPRLPQTAGTYQNASSSSIYATQAPTNDINCPNTTGSATSNYPNQLTGSNFERCVDFGQGTILFGAAITQRLSCVSSTSVEANDPYFGTSGIGRQNDVGLTPGEFDLVALPGGSSVSSGSTGINTSAVTYGQKLTTPPAVTRITSWAALVE